MLNAAHARRIGSIRRDEGGFSLALMSLFLVALLGMAGLVVDLGAWQVEASRIQQAADAAALAGVVRLPDGDTAAETRAIDVAADNGYVDGSDGVTVTVTPLGDESLEVSVTKTNVSQYFTRVVRGDEPTTITRRSTAQYVQPVPLGSPRNYLGTATLPIDDDGTSMEDDGRENFFLAVSGECSRREYGDRITPRAMSNPSSGHDCSGVHENPEHDERGYLFGVSVPAGAGTTELQAFDIPVCTNNEPSSPVYGEQLATFDMDVTVRRYDALDPHDGTVLFTDTFEGQSSTTGLCRFGTPSAAPDTECQDDDHLRACWHTLASVEEGEYTIQVDPEFRDTGRNERHNAFSLRAKTGPTFSPCTSDVRRDGDATATPPYRATCPQVFGLEHLPIYAGTSNDPLFYLASIDARHNGKTLQVTLFDPAEGAQSITLMEPDGDEAVVEWEILCADGSRADPGCTPAEQDPAGGRTGATSTGDEAIDVSGTVGTSERTFANNIQNGKYSDRLLRMTLQLPLDIDAAYGGETWWKLLYDCSGCGDRTTWSVQLLGDPVRLLPNSPPSTTTTTAAPVN